VTVAADLTAERVWAALAEVPDPEIPVISVVDLGVVRDVQVDGDRVRVEFTPTFLGCPALDVMRTQMADAVRALGAEAEVVVVGDDAWSTDRITPAGREKLREAGYGPPTPRPAGAVQLVQLQKGTFRCPYCNACRQPFEQFKTI
jgi:ring-1,2-phenylacetyl-CoA epoxidase subunit PaaD